MRTDKTYNHELDVWVDEHGNHFIKNEFNPGNPQWLEISANRWSISYGGLDNYIDWGKFDLPPHMLESIKAVTIGKMKKTSPAHLSMLRHVLENLQKLIQPGWVDFSNISTSDMVTVWEGLNQRYRLVFRDLYRIMAKKNICGARADIAFEISKWKARNEVVLLGEVLQWNDTLGALTSHEEKVLREFLQESGVGYESDKEHAIRISTWLLLDTLKRPSQVLSIKKDGLKMVANKDTVEWFVEILPVKYQTGLPARWWAINKELAQEIITFGERKTIAELQNKYDRLIVWDAPCLREHGRIATQDCTAAIKAYFNRRRAISPRTQKLLNVTPLRIRHTGATRLAFQGVARDIIQEILEHDSPESAQAYIDAVASEIVPQIEKAGEMRGNIFFELNKKYFQGNVTKDVQDKPQVFVPEFTPTPVLVGVCSRDTLKDGVCPKHPFLSCYDGCSCFSAWDNPDPHTQAIKYFEKEIARWEAATSGDKKNPAAHNAIDTYKRAADSAREVLTQIAGESS